MRKGRREKEGKRRKRRYGKDAAGGRGDKGMRRTGSKRL